MKRRPKQRKRSLPWGIPREFKPAVSPWAVRYEQFREQFPDWQTWLNGEEPVYALPQALTELLLQVSEIEGTARTRQPLLTTKDAERERAFAALCSFWHPHAVGMWRHRTIAHWALATAYKLEPGGPSDTLPIHPYDFAKRAAVEGVWNIGDEERVRRLQKEFRHGVVECLGHFLFEPRTCLRFRKDLEPVISLWRDLPRELQVPVRRIETKDLRVVRECDGFRAVVSKATEFSMAWDRLLSRWGLVGFITWDLPIIPAPMLGEQLWIVREALPMDAVVNFWPPQIRCPPEIALNEAILAQQGEYPLVVSNWLGEDTKARRGPPFPRAKGTRREESLSTFEKVMLMHIAERAIRQRYGMAPAMASRLCEAYLDWFGFQSLQVVKNHRKHYLKYLSVGPTPVS